MDVNDESPTGWTIRCDGCGKEETFPQVKLADALSEIARLHRWPRLAPMALQANDYCSDCAQKAGQ